MAELNKVTVTVPEGIDDEVLQITNCSAANYRLAYVISMAGQYTFSVWAKADAGMNVEFRVLGNVYTESVTTEWRKLVFTVDASSTTYIDICPAADTALYLYKGMLQQGQFDTDWKPAPEDTDLRLSVAESSITQLADSIELRVEKDGVISAINQTAESVRISADKVQLDGYVTMTSLSTPGATIVDGGNIQTGIIDGNVVAVKDRLRFYDEMNDQYIDAFRADASAVEVFPQMLCDNGLQCYGSFYASDIWGTPDADTINIHAPICVNDHTSPIGSILTASTTDVALATGTAGSAAVTSITLPAGTWLMVGAVYWPAASGSYRLACFNTTSGTISYNNAYGSVVAPTNTPQTQQVVVPLSYTSSTTVYLNARQDSGSSLSVNGYIRAVRIA